MRAGGGHVTRLTFEPAAGDYLPAWSPDGRKIVFASDRDGSRTSSRCAPTAATSATWTTTSHSTAPPTGSRSTGEMTTTTEL